MAYDVIWGKFSLKNYDLTIEDFKKAKNNQIREDYFQPIAEDILELKKFKKIKCHDISQSVPFDFIAKRNGTLALIEMKGSIDTFNYSKATQYARLLRVIDALKEEQSIKPDIFLIQLNLTLETYQILDNQFYSMVFPIIRNKMKEDQKLGKHQNIKTSLEEIEKYLQEN